MRILAYVALTGVIFASLFSQIAEAQTSQALDQNGQQKSTIETDNSIDQKISEIKSYNDNFVTPLYIARDYMTYPSIKLASYKRATAGYFTINASAYTAAADECGKSDGITASGKRVAENHTLACPKNFAFGTEIEIDGMGIYVCEDRGGAIKGNHVDIYVKTKTQAFAFGRQNLLARVVE